MRRVAASALLVACVVACSSTSSEPPSNAPNAFVGPGASECPSTDPRAGGSCSKEGLTCEYGGDYNPICNTTRTCMRGSWGTMTVNQAGHPTCPTPKVPTPSSNPAAECPNAMPHASDPCQSNVTCEYAETTCACSNGNWVCFKGIRFCTTPRPRLGTPCSANDECVIEAVSDCDKTVLTCGREGSWTASKRICL